MTLRLFIACGTLVLTACKGGPAAVDLTPSAEFFLSNGGLGVVGTPARPLTRPCLRPLSMSNTLLGGLVGASTTLVDFVKEQKLARVVRSAQASGYEKVVFTPTPPYEANWIGEGEFKAFCFGRPKLVKVEAVPDAQPITAGAGEPYLIPGTPARAARLTFRLDDVPGGTFVEGLKSRPAMLSRGSMRPEDYGQDLTVVATLPVDVKHFKTQP